MPCCLFLSFLLRSVTRLFDRASKQVVVVDSFAPQAYRSGPALVVDAVMEGKS